MPSPQTQKGMDMCTHAHTRTHTCREGRKRRRSLLQDIRDIEIIAEAGSRKEPFLLLGL